MKTILKAWLIEDYGEIGWTLISHPEAMKRRRLTRKLGRFMAVAVHGSGTGSSQIQPPNDYVEATSYHVSSSSIRLFASRIDLLT